MVQGRCRDLPPEIFFPSDGVGVEVARHYCAECPVKGPCLEYALENHIEHGVWGGASERERRRIARSRRTLGRPVQVAAPADPRPPAMPARLPLQK
ncbi:MAG TPA: WhiB family transcriptional regulator [Acidimicrobiales bacterium]|nr:WhiB family transcriptional regulator [Acidimicrobiales bacterium]